MLSYYNPTGNLNNDLELLRLYLKNNYKSYKSIKINNELLYLVHANDKIESKLNYCYRGQIYGMSNRGVVVALFYDFLKSERNITIREITPYKYDDDYYCKGIGTEILKYLFEFAKGNNCKLIKGILVDKNHWSRLVHFYTKNGFEIVNDIAIKRMRK